MASPLEDRLPKLPFVIVSGLCTVGLLYLLIGQGVTNALYASLITLLFVSCMFSVRISLGLLVLSMLLSPEMTMAETARREVTLRLEDLLLMVMSAGWLLRMAFFKDLGFTLKNRLNLPILVYSAIIALSTTLGVARGQVDPASGAFFAIKIIEYFVLFNMVVNYVDDVKHANSLLTLLLITCAAICLYSIFLVMSGGVIEAPFENGTGERNTLSGYLVFVGAIGAGVLIKSRSSFERIIIGFILPILIIVLMFSISRSGWISSIVALLVLFFNAGQKRIFFVLIVLIIAVLPLIAPKVVEDRVNYTFQRSHQGFRPADQVEIFGVLLDQSTSARIISAQVILDRFIDHPFLGRGMTGFGFIDGQYFRVLIELGIFGLVAFVWVMAAVHGFIRRASRLNLPPRLSGMVIGFEAGFWALMAHGLSANTFLIVRIAEPFWFFTGLLVVCVIHQDTIPGATAQNELTVSPSDADPRNGLIRPI